jgi:hypothetical protein
MQKESKIFGYDFIKVNFIKQHQFSIIYFVICPFSGGDV